jgi:nitrogen fixation protein FixH
MTAAQSQIELEDAQSIAQKEKTAQFLWTGFIVLFFVLQAILWVFAITLTANDKSHAIVEGYDEKALRWDEEKALRAASARLGWKSDISVDAEGDLRGYREIRVNLVGADDTPLTGANVNLRVFHRAYAGEPQVLDLKETEPGIYVAKVLIYKTGLWQSNGQAELDGNVFLFEDRQRLEIGP